MARYGMVIDLAKCMGCRTCMVACKMENGTPASHFYQYVFRFEEGTYPDAKVRFLPRPCNHCDNPPCVAACPNDARVRWKNGLVLTDVDNCKGTRKCEQACPYGVNSFNLDDPAGNQYLDWQTADIEGTTGGIAPPYWKAELDASYRWDDDPTKKDRRVAGAGHRMSTVGKCTFCVHRLEAGRSETACQESCPVGAIGFGDLDDPSSAVSQLLAGRGGEAFRLKESGGTSPKVYYLGRYPDGTSRLIEAAPAKDGVVYYGRPETEGVMVPW